MVGFIERRPATEADIPFLLALRRDTMNAHLRRVARTLTATRSLPG